MIDKIKKNYNEIKHKKIGELKNVLHSLDEENSIAISEGYLSFDDKLLNWSLYNIQSMINFCNGVEN